MLVSDFDFSLPDQLIARYPEPERIGSRLLAVDGSSSTLFHHSFMDILDYVQPGDLMVFNNTRVIPARLFGEKSTGGKIEILVERILDEHAVLAHVRSNKSLKLGAKFTIENDINVEVVERQNELFVLRFIGAEPVIAVLNRYGHMPLPPYIKREDELIDKERYQTVYAEKEGAVAAPTAGLHFDKPLLAQLQKKGVQIVYVTLHVGAGTFQPVRVSRVEEHHMHSEYLEVSENVCAAVQKTKQAGGRIIAVGTTSVRCLETASFCGDIAPYQGETDIFIYPGYEFKCVDLLLTNFHLPQSTLLMLVSAFTGKALISRAYEEAVKEKYRFFSYGDAMLLSREGLPLKPTLQPTKIEGACHA